MDGRKTMSMSEKKIKNVFVQGAITPAYIAESIAHHSVKKISVPIVFF